MGMHSKSDQTPKRGARLVGPLINVSLLLAATLLVIAVGEGLFRYRFGPVGYHPPEAVLRIQEHLITNSAYGFAWRPNVTETEEIVFDVADVEFAPLSTDAFGFINHPDATQIADVDVLGLGDSFVEHAAHTWFELAKARGLIYHNMALHRTAPPQYAQVFEQHGAATKPDWVVIGLFENDFTETSDFYQWEASELDWFRFHSGTWCGPPAATTWSATLRDGFVPGWFAAYRNARASVRGNRMTIAGPTHDEIDRVVDALRDIIARARTIPSRVLLVLIPSKPTTIEAPTKEAEAYDAVVQALENDDTVDVLDLRSTFREHADPSSLYYEVDGHWNRTGIEFAGRLVFEHIVRANGASS